jgi:hypothetical protein
MLTLLTLFSALYILIKWIRQAVKDKRAEIDVVEILHISYYGDKVPMPDNDEEALAHKIRQFNKLYGKGNV